MNASNLFSEKLSKLAKQAGTDKAMRGILREQIQQAIKILDESQRSGYIDEIKCDINQALYYLKFALTMDEKSEKEVDDATL